jgi:glycosyltransferase involved in cell wall biosynthesis
MNIVIFTSGYPGKGRHGGPFVQTIARALARHHRVIVVYPFLIRPSELFQPPYEVETEGNLTIYRPRYLYLRGIWWVFYILSCFWWSRKLDWSTVDIVHANWAIPSGFAAMLLSHWHNKPFILTEHSGRVDEFISSLSRRITMHWTIKHAQCVLTVSQALQQNLINQGIIARSFKVVPNAVDPAIFYPDPAYRHEPSQPVHFLWVGSFKPAHYRNKGIVELLQAVSLARQHGTRSIRLTLVGDGAARAECETLAQNLDVADICHFAGAMPPFQVGEWMRNCDALVVASLIESFGVVVIEALACGKPVIATRCGGPEEIVTPETGILVEPGNPQALAEAIVALVDNLEAFDAEHIAAYAQARYNPDSVARMLTHVYEEVRYNSKREKEPTETGSG